MGLDQKLTDFVAKKKTISRYMIFFKEKPTKKKGK